MSRPPLAAARARRGARHGASRRGFTFLEVMLVLFILALVMAIVTPNLRPQKGKFELGQASRRVVAMMRFARAKALATHQYVYLDFDMTAGSVRVRTKADDDAENAPLLRRPAELRPRRGADVPRVDDPEYLVFDLGPTVRFHQIMTYEELIYEGGTRARVYFYPDGKASRATVVLASDRPSRDGRDVITQYYSVELYRATGLVSSDRGLPAPADDIAVKAPPIAGRREADESYTGLVENLTKWSESQEKAQQREDRGR